MLHQHSRADTAVHLFKYRNRVPERRRNLPKVEKSGLGLELCLAPELTLLHSTNRHAVLEGRLPQLGALSACRSNSPAPLSVPDPTPTISPRRASMTCTCEGLQNVTSRPSLRSPGAAVSGPVSSRVLVGWGRLAPPSEPGRLLQLSACCT